jgi:hypothetical protein
MHHIKKAPVALAVVGSVLALVAVGVWGFGISAKAAVIGGHAVLLTGLGVAIWLRHHHKSSSEPPAA